MANEDTALREVDQELAEERQWEMFRKYGPLVIGGALAIVLGVAGWVWWNAHKTSVAETQALVYRDAVELLSDDQDEGRDALNALAEEGGGYGVLAQFHRAASYARGGERLKAVETYREIYNNGSTSKRVRELARLRAAYLSLADGREAVLDDLGDLPNSTGAFSVYARETSALAALGAKDYETALSMFRQLSIDIAAPEPVRTRAEDFAALAASGKAGVNITGETRVDDLIDALGEAIEVGGDEGAAPVAQPEDDHAGHDHGEAETDDGSVSDVVDGESETE